eukprot:2675353-Rhodomonas_salina.1
MGAQEQAQRVTPPLLPLTVDNLEKHRSYGVGFLCCSVPPQKAREARCIFVWPGHGTRCGSRSVVACVAACVVAHTVARVGAYIGAYTAAHMVGCTRVGDVESFSTAVDAPGAASARHHLRHRTQTLL